jgi:hypothetical protein
MNEDDSSSEDDDYKPSVAEVNEAEADSQGQKRRKVEDEKGSKKVLKSFGILLASNIASQYVP